MSEEITFEIIHEKLKELEEAKNKENEELKKEIEKLNEIIAQHEEETKQLQEEIEELKKKQHIPKPEKFNENINQAAATGDMDSILFILQDAPDLVNSQDFEHLDTPLHEAIWKSHFDIVQLLVKRGADVNSRNRVLFFFTF